MEDNHKRDYVNTCDSAYTVLDKASGAWALVPMARPTASLCWTLSRRLVSPNTLATRDRVAGEASSGL